VVVGAGQSVDTAMALDGNVIVRKGAKVKSAVAVNGNVVIEARSKVTGTAAAFGGKIQLAPDAKIEGSRLELANGLRVTAENGKQVDLKLSISGESLSDLLLAKMVEKARSCRIQQGTDGGIHIL
jgi:acyl-[acyl carrier protein]--UDP-N-acetylglucosamine O-acyltransferase